MLVGRCSLICRFRTIDANGELDQAQAQGIELGDAPARASRHQRAQGPHQPVGAGMQKQAQLVGARRWQQEVRSAARWVFHALMWFSAWPRAQ